MPYRSSPLLSSLASRLSWQRLATVSAVAVATLAGAPSLAASATTAGAATSTAASSFTVVEGVAGNATGLTPTVNAYRALLGDPNNGSTPGSQPAGRREINWDGTPDASSDPNQLPRDFFNTTVPRGVVFSSGSQNRFLVSADSSNPTSTPVRFGRFNPQYPNIFNTFSAERLFTPVGTNKMTVRFFEPGTTNPATVHGFGAVFTDVDTSTSTRIELYDQWGGLLWGKNVRPGSQWSSKSLSFLGVATDADVYEVRITSGNTPLSAGNSDGGSWDVVAMDDFLYGEPQRL